LEPNRLDFHRNGAPDYTRALPQRPNSPGRAFEAETIERIRRRAGVEFSQAFDDGFTFHLSSSNDVSASVRQTKSKFELTYAYHFEQREKSFLDSFDKPSFPSTM